MDSGIPQDSVLRRHYVQQALGSILATMPPRPTDSVLRRHFDATVRTRLIDLVGADAAAIVLGDGAAVKAAPAPTTSPAAPRGAPRSAAPSPRAAAGSSRSSGQGGGFFGWLKRLFGG